MLQNFKYDSIQLVMRKLCKKHLMTDYRLDYCLFQLLISCSVIIYCLPSVLLVMLCTHLSKPILWDAQDGDVVFTFSVERNSFRRNSEANFEEMFLEYC